MFGIGQCVNIMGNEYCDQLASMGYCTNPKYADEMERDCKKSCRLCWDKPGTWTVFIDYLYKCNYQRRNNQNCY